MKVPAPLLVIGLLGAALMGAAWLVPMSEWGAVLGWLSTIILALFFLQNPRPLYVYLAGCLTYATGFYWLADTIERFGGFPHAGALAVFGLFVVVCAGQFSLCMFVLQRLPTGLKHSSIALPLAWVTSQYCWIGIFPWEPGHTQIGFPLFAQSADILGATLVTFLMWWICAALAQCVVQRNRTLRSVSLALGVSLLVLSYGYIQISRYTQLDHPLSVSLVQANISIADKNDVMFIEQNVERYLELSQPLAKNSDLIVWPESVIQKWIPTRVTEVRQHPLLAALPSRVSYIVGSLSFESKQRFFNSALAIDSSGHLQPHYHKRILMPFGEYVPLASIFPWLRAMTPIPQDFTAGQGVAVFDFPDLPAAPRIAPLICYEDIVPPLAAQSVRSGATMLVNLTNDAWFGQSPAALQHHQIASFRAIETRRFLLRSTNSGVTAVVDPLGSTVGSLPSFSEGILQAQVAPLGVTTLFVTLGDLWIWRILSWMLLLYAVSFGRRKAPPATADVP